MLNGNLFPPSGIVLEVLQINLLSLFSQFGINYLLSMYRNIYIYTHTVCLVCSCSYKNCLTPLACFFLIKYWCQNNSTYHKSMYLYWSGLEKYRSCIFGYIFLNGLYSS